ncbi:hypothetical protein BR1R3_28420 [Pseudomonas atacamensis]|uniref:hypothetical protein n=1 Tax=Pseudomonas atacamensis TaxID=2565368 RepID=UPI0022CBACF5|nr:hypothetical protein [Pseudomonas atacamensis]GLH20100.1 hypothetical protein BR1R3_28420 [Pseudomonas atacamensis]
MACSRGKASPNTHTKLRLFADSAGYCQNPACTTSLFQDVGEDNIHIAEMAHIFSATDGGPRTKSSLTKEERGQFTNLILLCANCHTKIDKAEDAFPDDLISTWKVTHSEKIRELFSVVEYSTRSEVFSRISPLLRSNHTIFIEYGPHGEHRFNAESEVARLWTRNIRTTILPNNRKLVAIISANRGLLHPSELGIVDLFFLHVEEFEARHLGLADVVNARFPEGMDAVYGD